MASIVSVFDGGRDSNADVLNRILSQLRGCTQPIPNQWQACCPIHKDGAERNQSFGVRLNADGSIDLNCFTGCPKPAILAALGVAPHELVAGHSRPPGTARGPRPAVTPKAPARDRTPPEEWEKRCAKWSAFFATSSAARSHLAQALRVPEDTLKQFPGLGCWDDRPGGPAWAFPERDAKGRIVGVGLRTRKHEKSSAAGSARGLSIPAGWKERPGPLFLVEGPSDVLAMTAAGLAAIGRPSVAGRVEMLAELLRDDPREAVWVIEQDGVMGASWKAAEKLAELLGRSIKVARMVGPAKDPRQFFNSRVGPTDPPDRWHECGRELALLLQATTETIEATPCQPFGCNCGRGRACKSYVEPESPVPRVSPESFKADVREKGMPPAPPPIPPRSGHTPKADPGASAVADGIKRDELVAEVARILFASAVSLRATDSKKTNCGREKYARDVALGWVGVLGALERETKGKYCTAATFVTVDGISSTTRSFVGDIQPACRTLSCPACFVFRRRDLVGRLCEPLANGELRWGDGPCAGRIRVCAGDRDAHRSMLSHLSHVAERDGTAAPAHIIVTPVAGGNALAVLIGGPDPARRACGARRPCGRRRKYSGDRAAANRKRYRPTCAPPRPPARTWSDPVEVSPELAADLLAAALSAIVSHKAEKGRRHRPVDTTPGLFPKEVKEKHYARVYDENGKPPERAITNEVGVVALERVGAHDVQHLPTGAGVPGDEKIIIPLGGRIAAAARRADFLDMYTGKLAVNAPLPADADPKRWPAVGWRPPSKPKKPRPRDPFAGCDRVSVADVVALSAEPKSVKAVAKIAASIADYYRHTDDYGAEVAAIRALSGTRGGLARAVELLRQLLEQCGRDPLPWMVVEPDLDPEAEPPAPVPPEPAAPEPEPGANGGGGDSFFPNAAFESNMACAGDAPETAPEPPPGRGLLPELLPGPHLAPGPSDTDPGANDAAIRDWWDSGAGLSEPPRTPPLPADAPIVPEPGAASDSLFPDAESGSDSARSGDPPGADPTFTALTADACRLAVRVGGNWSRFVERAVDARDTNTLRSLRDAMLKIDARGPPGRGVG